MYDRVSLKGKLISAGYKDVLLQSHDSSLYRNWVDYGLDVDESGCEQKPGSLYMEAPLRMKRIPAAFLADDTPARRSISLWTYGNRGAA